MSKFPRNSVLPLKVSMKSSRSSEKKPAGSVMASARSIEKRGTPNLQKTLTESVCSNEQNEKISEEDVHVKKPNSVAAPSVSDESVITNNGGFQEHDKKIIQEIETENDDIAPANLSIPEPLTSSLQDEYFLEEQLTAESSVIDGNVHGTLQAYSFAPAKIAVATDENVGVSRRNADLETVITEIESEHQLSHTESDRSTVGKGNGITEETVNIPSNLELAIAIIKAAHAHPEASVTSGMHDAAKEIIHEVLSMAVKDLPKPSPTVQNNSKYKSKVCLSNILAGVLSAISMAAVSFVLFSNPKQGFNFEPPPT